MTFALLGTATRSVLNCSEKFRNFHGKTPVLESLFNNVSGWNSWVVCSCEYCKIFKNTYFEEHLPAAKSEQCRIQDPAKHRKAQEKTDTVLCIPLRKLLLLHVLSFIGTFCLTKKEKKFFVGTLVKNKIKTLTVFFNCIVQLKFLKFLCYFLHIGVHPNWVYIYISVQFNF